MRGRDLILKAGGVKMSLTAQVQALFAGGKVGGMWDMGDTATLFQDAAGATPVTAVTQPIGRVNDKSGNGNHATQPTAGWLPLYQVDGGYGCAQFDGIDDLLSTAAIDLSASDKAVFSIAFVPNNFTPSVLAEFGPNANTTNGSFYLSCGWGGAGSWHVHARATTADQVKNVSAITAGVPVVITVAFDLSSDVPSSRIIVRVNGAVVSTAVAYDQTGSASNFTSQIMNFGARAAGLFPSNSKIFTAALIGGALTVPEIELLDRWTRSTVGL